MLRADIIFGSCVANMRNGAQSSYMVQVGTTVYAFYIDNNQNLFWTKSTDGGFSWSDTVAITTAVTITSLSVWYDKWTPGNTGTLIHLAYIETSADDVLYRALDTSGDTLGTQTVIFAGATTSTVFNACIALTRAIGGNLLCMGDIDGGTEVFVSRSVDVGANWTARATIGGPEGADYYLLAPGFAADTQDCICIFWDRSASEISRKLYDDSGDAWSETSIATGMAAIAANVCAPQFSITVDDVNNKIVLIAWTNRHTANADLLAWTIDESTITALTDVVTNSGDDQQCCALALDSANGDLYAFYGGKSDGSEVAGTAINIYYKISTDDGATWGSETLLTGSARNFNGLYTSPIFTRNLVTMMFADLLSNDYLLTSAAFPVQARARVAIGVI